MSGHQFFQIAAGASQFWKTAATSGPTPWNVIRFWDREVRPLRLEGRPRPTPLGLWREPHILQFPSDAVELAAFWREHYGGADWYLDAPASWISNILSASLSLALAVKDERGGIVGSVVCRAVGGSGSSNGRFWLGKVDLDTAFVIEGLCIRADWRGRHLAGWLIAWVDHIKNAQGPQAFFWSREAPPRDITYVACHTYGYVDLRLLRPSVAMTAMEPPLERIAWDSFRQIWESYVARWDILEDAAFPTSLPHDPLLVWRCGADYVVVSDTRRRLRAGGAPIWECVFCGDLYEPLAGFTGSPERQEWGRRMLETVGSQYLREGVLFVSSAAWQGGVTAAWPAPWRYGTAGDHTTYIYNYMPPTFHTLAPLFLRNEI